MSKCLKQTQSRVWKLYCVPRSNMAHFSRCNSINDTISSSVFFIVSLGGVRLSPLGTSATVGLLYQPLMIDECEAVGGMRIGKGNRSIRRKPAPVPLCPPQISHDLTWDRTRAAAAVGSRRLTAWAMARPDTISNSDYIVEWFDDS
jgi:hypothetical protein